MKIGKFCGKRSNGANFPRSPTNFPKIGGKCEPGGNASLPQRGWTPLCVQMYKYIYTSSFSLSDSSDITNCYSGQGAPVIAINRAGSAFSGALG